MTQLAAAKDVKIAQDFEVSLHMAFVDARQKCHEFITVEDVRAELQLAASRSLH